MKFSIFHQVERYDDSISHRQLQEELTELTLLAERGGFDKVWIGEHHAMEFTVSPNAFVSLAYLASITSTIRLGTGTVIAPFYNPIRLAGEIGQLDVMSNGRVEVGIARGAYNFEYDRQFPNEASFTGDTRKTDLAWDAGLRMRELVPATQGVQASDPGEAAYDPAEHTIHWVDETWAEADTASSVKYDPATQLVQSLRSL